MKEIIHRDQIVPYREIVKPSPLPYLAAGIACLLCGFVRPVYRILDYALMAGIGFVIFLAVKALVPGETVRVELPPDTGLPQADQLLKEAREALTSFRMANERIADSTVSCAIEGIERAGIAILAQLEKDPGLHGQLRTFLRYYLPTTKKILDARADIEKEGVTTDGARRLAARADQVLPEIQRAFEKQLEALHKHSYLDIQVEMDVLEGMLKGDGLA